MHGLTPLSADIFFIENEQIHDIKLRASDSLILPRLHNRCSDNDFFFRRIKVWNSLPDTLRNADSISIFKRLLNDVDFSKFLLGSMWNS